VDVVNVMTHAYVTITAATAMTIKSSVASIGEIPFFDRDSEFTIFNKYETAICTTNKCSSQNPNVKK